MSVGEELLLTKGFGNYCCMLLYIQQRMTFLSLIYPDTQLDK